VEVSARRSSKRSSRTNSLVHKQRSITIIRLIEVNYSSTLSLSSPSAAFPADSTPAVYVSHSTLQLLCASIKCSESLFPLITRPMKIIHFFFPIRLSGQLNFVPQTLFGVCTSSVEDKTWKGSLCSLA